MVEFETNGGSEIAAKEVAPNTPVVQPANPTRTYYTFAGWFTDNNTFANAYNFSTPVTGNLTLFAKWNINVTLVYSDVPATPPYSVDPRTQVVEYGSKMTVPTPPTVSPLYNVQFHKWYKDENKTIEWDFDNEIITAPITIYGTWACRVYFRDVDTQYIEAGKKPTRPTPDPTREHYEFDGWYHSNGTLWDFDNDVITQSVIIEPKWIPNQYTVTINPNGGNWNGNTDNLVIKKDYNTAVARPDDPVRANHIFIDWYGDAALSTLYNFSTPVSGDITIYAKWIEDASYSSSYDFGSGSVPANAFDVSNKAQWENAVAVINLRGNNQNYIINVLDSFAVPGGSSGLTAANINVAILGNGKTISLESNGTLLNTTSTQKFIIYNLTMKGRNNDDNGADNNNSLIINRGTMELTGTTTVTGNVNAVFNERTAVCMGGGIYNAGTLTMRDNSAVTNNSVTNTIDGSVYMGDVIAFGGGVYNSTSGTFIMRDDSSVSGNIACTTRVSGQSVDRSNAFGGGVYSEGFWQDFMMYDRASITGNSVSASGGGSQYGSKAFGGGVFLNSQSRLRIQGGTISNNTAGKGSEIYAYTNGVDQLGSGETAQALRGIINGSDITLMGNLLTTGNPALNTNITIVEGNIVP